jgi:hypothetical protein
MTAKLDNPPGLRSISYRAVRYGSAREVMLDGLARDRGWLRDLNTRDPADPSIALLDSWAIAGDVLSFYAERIANESYLPTAQERRSIRSLARLIDYELRPGKAAEAWIAFTLETAAGAPQEVAVPVGVRIKSVPGPGETMATFETVEAITARPHLNAMLPRLTVPQTPSDVSAAQSALCVGVLSDVRHGDWLLLATNPAAMPALHRAAQVTLDTPANRTRIDMTLDPPRPVVGFAFHLIVYTPQQSMAGVQLSGSFVQGQILGQAYSQTLFEDDASASGLNLYSIYQHLWIAPKAPPLPPETGLFRFKSRVGIFGHNVPAKTVATETVTGDPPNVSAMFSGRTVRLDTDLPDLREGGWIAFVPTTGTPFIARVAGVVTATHRYGKLTGRTTRVTIDADPPSSLLGLSTTEVLVLVDSAPLPLAPLPVTEAVTGSSLPLNAYYPGLVPGRPVTVTGERSDLAGVIQSEVHVVDHIDLVDGYSALALETAVVGPFRRDSVTINANMALATHGESETQPIGHGNGSVGGQSFALPIKPLTHIGVPTPPGAAAALTIRVDGLLWTPILSLRDAGPLDPVYALRHQEDGSTIVQFGDGINGRRLPSGTNNVVASWRKGLGQTGMVRAGQLTLLSGAPQGVKSAVNPLPAYGAADGESIDDARRNAPLSVMTLGRIVTLTDYADFARAFIGVAKAHAIWSWSGTQRAVLLTVAGIDGAPLESRDMDNLRAAIAAVADRAIAVRIENHRSATFRLSGTVRVNAAHVPDIVIAAIKQDLAWRFGFAQRDVGQAVARSEVIAAIQGIAGVDWVDLDSLYRTGGSGNAVTLPAALPRSGSRNGGAVLPAELLTLHPSGADLRAMS